MGSKLPGTFQLPQNNWHVRNLIIIIIFTCTRLVYMFVFPPLPQLYSFIAATTVFGPSVVVSVVRWHHVKGDISACPLSSSVSVSCRVKDTIYVTLTAVMSYNSLKLLDSCLQENKAHMGNCYVISDYIYIYI